MEEKAAYWKQYLGMSHGEELFKTLHQGICGLCCKGLTDRNTTLCRDSGVCDACVEECRNISKQVQKNVGGNKRASFKGRKLGGFKEKASTGSPKKQKKPRTPMELIEQVQEVEKRKKEQAKKPLRRISLQKRLDVSQIKYIRDSKELPGRELAEMFNISVSSVCRIQTKKKWATIVEELVS